MVFPSAGHGAFCFLSAIESHRYGYCGALCDQLVSHRFCAREHYRIGHSYRPPPATSGKSCSAGSPYSLSIRHSRSPSSRSLQSSGTPADQRFFRCPFTSQLANHLRVYLRFLHSCRGGRIQRWQSAIWARLPGPRRHASLRHQSSLRLNATTGLGDSLDGAGAKLIKIRVRQQRCDDRTVPL